MPISRTRSRSYKRLGGESDTAFVVFMGLAALLSLLATLSLFPLSIVTYTIIQDAKQCTMENCVNTAADCEIKICTLQGECLSLGDIEGCCNSGVNCTAQASNANYAFASICYSQISTCQPT